MATYFDPARVDAAGPHAVADAVELQLIASDEAYLSYAEFRSCFPAGSAPAAADLESGFAVTDDRRRTMGAHYPFHHDGQGVAIDRTDSWRLYALLLVLSLRGTPFRNDKDWKRSDPLFDAIVTRAFRTEYGQALHFGWPPRGGRPSTFPEALGWAAETIGIELRSKDQKLPTHRQDGGVDVIAWRPYADGASGFRVALVQDTVQENFAGKPGDVDPLQWRDWITFGNLPGVAMAVPFVVPAEDPIRPQLVSRLSDFMDRSRLMEVLSESDPTSWPEWDDITRFVDDQVEQVRSDAEGGARVSVAPAKVRKKKPRPPRPG